MNSNNLGRIIKQQRKELDMTLKEVSEKSGVSASHLGRIERGDRFPSGHILRKLAKALELDENELFVMAGYLSPKASTGEETAEPSGRVDPYVAMVLSKESFGVQRTVVAILALLKSIAKGLPNT